MGIHWYVIFLYLLDKICSRCANFVFCRSARLFDQTSTCLLWFNIVIYSDDVCLFLFCIVKYDCRIVMKLHGETLLVRILPLYLPRMFLKIIELQVKLSTRFLMADKFYNQLMFALVSLTVLSAHQNLTAHFLSCSHFTLSSLPIKWEK